MRTDLPLPREFIDMSKPDYAAYLPVGDSEKVWGVSMPGAGFTRVKPGMPYPPLRHPLDRLFTWSTGRVLNAYQVVYITAGAGSFESQAYPKRVMPIAAGTAFLLFPGVWHRYSPDQAVGWVENWIELRGDAVDRLRRQETIAPDRPIYNPGMQGDLLGLYEQCHHLARLRPPGYQPVLGTLGLQIIAQLGLSAGAETANRPLLTAIEQAQAQLETTFDQPISIQDLAQSLGVGYSAFRRAFKERTGVSPKQFHLDLRLRKAMELLGQTDLQVQQIAEMLGFDSGFHLSALIKARTGSPPSAWRAQVPRR